MIYLKRIWCFAVLILLFAVSTAPMTTITGTGELEGWSEDIRLTNNNESSTVPSIAVPSIAIEGNNIHIVFSEYFSPAATANRSLCYIRSLDNGDNWDTLRRINTTSGKAYDPKVAVNGPNVHIIWRDKDDKKVHYIRSIDNGNSWSNETIISTETYLPYGNHNIAVYENNIYIVYVNENRKITYVCSFDNGVTWSIPTVLVKGSSMAVDTGIAVHRNNVHIIWVDIYNRKGELANQIYYIRSTDNGISWEMEINISTVMGNTQHVSWPDIAVSEEDIYAVYCVQDYSGGNREIFYSFSKDNGLNWTKDIQLSQSVPNTYNFNPSITLLENDIYIAWFHLYVFLKSSNNGGINWTPDTRLSNVTSHQIWPDVASNQNSIHIVWVDNRDGNEELYYKKILIEPQKVFLNVNIDPDTLNLKSKGRWITAYIEISPDYDVSNIDITSLLLEDSISAEKHPVKIEDYNGNGILDLMVKFDRADLEDIVYPAPQFELTITGRTYLGVPLEGSDSIRIF